MKTTKRILAFTLVLSLLLSCFTGIQPLQAQATEPRLGLREIFPLSFETSFLVGNGFIIYSNQTHLGGALLPLAPGEEHIVCDFEGNELFRTSDYFLYPLEGIPYTQAIHIETDEDGRPLVFQIGLFNLQGEVIIPVEYADVRPASGGFALCQYNPSATGLNNSLLIGFANEAGEVINEPQYATSYSFDPVGLEFFFGQKDDIWHCVELNSGAIRHTFDPELSDMRSITFPGFSPEYPWVRALKGELWGIVDYDGNVLLPFEYEAIKTFSDGLCWVKQDGLCGLVDSEFNIVLPPTLDLVADMSRYQMWFDFQQGYAPVQNAEGLWGLINSKGEMIADFGYYEEISTPNNTTQQFRPVVVKKDGLWGLVGSEGKLLTEIEYKHVMWFANDRGFVCTIDGTWLLLDGSGEIIAELLFDLSNYVMTYPEEQSDGTIIQKEVVLNKTFDKDVLDVPFGDSFALIDREANILAQGFDVINTHTATYPFVTMQKDGFWGLWEVVQLAADEELVVVVAEVNAVNSEAPTGEEAAQNPENTDMTPAAVSELPILIEIASGRVSRGEEQLSEMPALPQIVEDRVLLPFRYLIENILGGSASYDAATETISAEVAGISYSMKIGDNVVLIDDSEHNFGVAPIRNDDTVLVPLRVFEAAVSKIAWDGEAGTVSIVP